MTTTTERYRVARIVHEGETYYPVVDGTRLLSPDELATLAHEPDPAAPVRQMLCVLADEGMPRTAPHVPLVVRRLQIQDGAPVVYLDTGLVVGRCERITVLPAGTLEGAEGDALVATVRVQPTRLGTLTWQAVRAGYFGGLCVEVVAGRVERVQLGGAENSCLAGALVVDSWEGERG